MRFRGTGRRRCGAFRAGAARSGTLRGGTALLLLLGTAACDNVAKMVPYFATMVDGPTVETYEARPVPPPEGTVPVTGRSPGFPLPVADTTTALRNPLSGTPGEIDRGRTAYTQFCLPCHGPEGRGRGPVVNVDGQEPRRLPLVPALDLTSGTGPDRSDGYIWGMIENGRGMMPSYRRIPEEERWYLIEYVRQLQRQAGATPRRGVAGNR